MRDLYAIGQRHCARTFSDNPDVVRVDSFCCLIMNFSVKL